MISEQTTPPMAAPLKRGVTFSTHTAFSSSLTTVNRFYRDRTHA
jgi:hypothetical protein